MQSSACDLQDPPPSIRRRGSTLQLVERGLAPDEDVRRGSTAWSGAGLSRLRRSTAVRPRFAQVCRFIRRAEPRERGVGLLY
jgi:hypothetical protein